MDAGETEPVLDLVLAFRLLMNTMRSTNLTTITVD
jgi:hypothetical protein